MAARQLVLSAPLCFILNKVGKIELALLRKLLLNFYDVEALADAKRELHIAMDDMSDMSVVETLRKRPRITMRRDSDNRNVHELDDIFAMITYMDECKLLEKLPVFVADHPDSMPTIGVSEGEFTFIFRMLEKMDSSMRTTLEAMLLQVRSLEHGNQSRDTPRTQNQPTVVNKPSSYSQATGSQQNAGSSHNSAPANVNNAIAKTTHGPTASTPVASSLLSINWGGIRSGDESADDRPFTEVRSRRKRRRTRSALQRTAGVGERSTTDDEPATVNKGYMRSRRLPLIVGKSRAQDDQGNLSNQGFVAAKKYIKKAVYCVDNVHTSCDVEDLKEFVSSLDVRVISCFRVQPRPTPEERRNHTVPDHGTFRLCIDSEDRLRLLDADKWPSDIIISRWFFKQQKQKQDITIKETVHAVAGSANSANSVDSAAVLPTNSITPDGSPNVMDTTVVTIDLDQSVAVADIHQDGSH